MEEPRISDISKRLLIGTALFFDVMQGIAGLFHFIPAFGNIFALVLGYAFSILALLTLSVWFTTKGVSFFQGRKAGRRTLMWVSEYIPFINSLPIPGWTLYTWYTIKMSREEDKEKMEKNKESTLRLVKSAKDQNSRRHRRVA